MRNTTAIFSTFLPRLKAASPENRARWKKRPRRGTRRLRSGVIGLRLNRKPTCSTLPRIAARQATASTGAVRRRK